MEEPKQNVFVIWDPSDNEVRVALQAIARRPPQGFRVSFADPDKQGGDLLTEILIPQIQTADRVFVILSSERATLPAVNFELGLALGFGKPIAVGSVKYNESRMGQAHSLLHKLGFQIVLGLDTLQNLRAAFEQENLWYKYPLSFPVLSEREAVLCPWTGEGEALHEELTASLPKSSSVIPGSRELLHEVLASSSLLWIITAFGDTYSANEANALAAGAFYAQSLLRMGPSSRLPLRVLRSRQAPAIRSVQKFEKTFGDLGEFAALLRSDEQEGTDQLLRIEKVHILNFKSIDNLTLDFTAPSSLSGDWTCIAGINGAGKSSILQALVMVLLGEKLFGDFGSERIKRTCRRVGAERLNAEITVVLRDGDEQRTLYLTFTEQGLDRIKLYSHSAYGQMPQLWERLQKQVVVAYGATRNLSDFKDTRYSSLSPYVQRQMTLFDPLTQIANVDVLLEGKQESAPILKTLRAILAKVFGDELTASDSLNLERLYFVQCGTDLEAIELPDGFRSTVAWLADLCAAWHQSAPPEETADSDPAKIRGIVLLDEIDLHLHPSLQRALIPRLREALPNVQFIVTTHSPLVLSSFDRAELVVLDRDSKEGIRELDRQIFAFSTDQVYEWLMGTPPQSTVIEEKLGEATDPNLALYLYQSEERNEEQAEATLTERKNLIEELRSAKTRS